MSSVKPVPDGYHSLTPYLTIQNASAAIEYYKTVFGAKERLRMAGAEGKVGHAELEIGDSVLMLSDEYPNMGARAPQTLGGSPVGLMLYLPDVDAVVARAVAAGGTLTRPVEDQFYGDRVGGIDDPFGHRWYIATHIEDVPPDELERRAEKAMSA